MTKNDRKSYITNRIKTERSVSVVELSRVLQISEVSVRKLLSAMEQEGLLRRTWGGAVSTLAATEEDSYEDKSVRRLAEKQAIAKVAYEQIDDGDAIYLDSGTTTLQLAHLLASGRKRRVLVCTNAINIAYAFRNEEDIEVMLLGGAFHHKMLSCSGVWARNVLQTLHFDKGFLSGSHFSPERGFTTPNLEEAEIKRLILSAAQTCYMLADYSKYGNDSLALIAPAEAMQNLITDWHIPPQICEQMELKGVRVLLGAQQRVS